MFDSAYCTILKANAEVGAILDNGRRMSGKGVLISSATPSHLIIAIMFRYDGLGPTAL